MSLFFISTIGKMKCKRSVSIFSADVMLLRVTLFCALVGVGSAEPYHVDQDSDQYRLAKAQLDALEKESMSPRYGACWLNAIEMLKSSCRQLNEDRQHQLAFRFANCFLAKIGRPTYECDGDESSVELCVSKMNSEAVGIYTHFFTEAKSYCFVLQSQAWQERTHFTIKSLTDNSALVAEQMENSSELQALILKRQNDSVRYQEIALLQSAELRKAIEESKQIATQQNSVMAEVFDRIKVLQSLLIGEFTGIYSVAFYGGCMVVSYIFTTTARTSGARFWLFLFIVLSIMIEQVIVKFGFVFLESTEEIDVYNDILRLRKVFLVFYLAIYFWNAYHFKDYDKINNQLLVKLEQENRSNQLVLGKITHLCSELAFKQKSVTKDKKSEPLSADLEVTATSEKTFSHMNTTLVIRRIKRPSITPAKLSTVQYLDASERSTGYDDTRISDATDSICSNTVSSGTDQTYFPKDIESIQDSSLSTLTSDKTQSVLEELRILRHSTPFDELGSCPDLSFRSVDKEKPHQEQSSLSSSVSSRKSVVTSSSSTCPYNLRSRAGKAPLADNSRTDLESSESFYRQVKRGNMTSARSLDKLMATVKPLQPNREVSSSPNSSTHNSKTTSRKKVTF